MGSKAGQAGIAPLIGFGVCDFWFYRFYGVGVGPGAGLLAKKHRLFLYPGGRRPL